jgi:hypothetical protein
MAAIHSKDTTLNKIWLEEHAVIGKPYPEISEEDGMLKVADEH